MDQCLPDRRLNWVHNTRLLLLSIVRIKNTLGDNTQRETRDEPVNEGGDIELESYTLNNAREDYLAIIMPAFKILSIDSAKYRSLRR